MQLLGMAGWQLGAGLTGFEVMGQFALSLVGKHITRNCACPSWARTMRPVVRAAGKFRQRIWKNTPAHASNRCWQRKAFEAGCVTDAVVAENLYPGAPALAHPREYSGWPRPKRA